MGTPTSHPILGGSTTAIRQTGAGAPFPSTFGENVWKARKEDIEAAYAAKKASLREIKVTSADKW